jgi:hypothetical protein
MKEIDDRATAVLLASLNNEINIKCTELKEKHNEVRLKKIFFTSCLFILLSFLVQVFFKVINVNFLFGFIIYQGLALVILVPVVTNLNRRGLLK